MFLQCGCVLKTERIHNCFASCARDADIEFIALLWYCYKIVVPHGCSHYEEKSSLFLSYLQAFHFCFIPSSSDFSAGIISTILSLQ